jgi:anti-sigma factor RsiW
MTDCTNVLVRERLPDLLHERLDAVSRAEVQAHLAACAECAAELTLLREARRAMQRVPAVDVARIVAALPGPTAAAPPLRVTRGGLSPDVHRSAGRRGSAAPAWRRYAVAAGLLLAVGIPGASWMQSRSTPADGGPTVAGPAAASVAAEGGDRLLAVNVEGLTDDDFAGLLDGLENLDAVPASDPLPVMPVEPAAGGDD